MLKWFNPTTDPKILEIDKNLLQKLDMARQASGVPFIITSAKRNPDTNKSCGGVENSAHLKGLAVDIACSNSEDAYNIIFGALMAGFKRIGIGKGHIHMDIDATKPQRVLFVE
jgi:hypothetical protein